MDLFEDCFLFHTVKNNNDNNFKAHCLSLDNIALTSSLDSLIALVVTDASIKNWVTMSIAHIYYCYDLRSLGLDKGTTLILEKYKRTQ